MLSYFTSSFKLPSSQPSRIIHATKNTSILGETHSRITPLYYKIIRQKIQRPLLQLVATLSPSFLVRYERMGSPPLYHLQLVAVYSDGYMVMEKSPKPTSFFCFTIKGGEEQSIGNQKITPADLMTRTEVFMGNQFWSYNAFTNNCQDFVMALLQCCPNVRMDTVQAFVKQDFVNQLATDELVKNTETLTNLGFYL